MNDSSLPLGAAVLRLVLHPGETIRMPHGSVRVSVLSGCAWLTQAGRDHVVPAPGRLDLVRQSDAAVLSALGGTSLEVEIKRLRAPARRGIAQAPPRESPARGPRLAA
jgi:hypothetical protein